MIKYNQHRPGWADGPEPISGEVETVDQLLEVEFIKNFMKTPQTGLDFSHLALSLTDETSGHVMAVSRDGTAWVVASVVGELAPTEAMPLWTYVPVTRNNDPKVEVKLFEHPPTPLDDLISSGVLVPRVPEVADIPSTVSVMDLFTESDEVRQQRLLRYTTEGKIEVELLRIGAPTEATGKTYPLTAELTSEINRLISAEVLSEYGNPNQIDNGGEEYVLRVCEISPLNVCGKLSDIHLRTVGEHLYLYGAFQAIDHPDVSAEAITSGLLDGTLMMSMRALVSHPQGASYETWNVIKLVTFDVVPGLESDYAKDIRAERKAAANPTLETSLDENENTMSEVKVVEVPAVFSIEAMAQTAMAASLNYVQQFIRIVKPIKYLGIVQQRPVHIEVNFIECTDVGVKFTVKNLNTDECITFEHLFGNATVNVVEYADVSEGVTMTLVEILHVFNHTLVELVRLTESQPADEA